MAWSVFLSYYTVLTFLFNNEYPFCYNYNLETMYGIRSI